MYSLLDAQSYADAHGETHFEELWNTPHGLVRISSIAGAVFEKRLDVDTRAEILREIDNRPEGII